MAYVSIGGLVLVMVGSVFFLCAMSAITYARCVQIQEVGTKENTVRAFVPCAYDPNPLGLAIAACLGAFGSPIGALALYMGQNKRSGGSSKTTTTKTETVATAPDAATVPAPTVAAPMPVKLVSPDPVPTREVPKPRKHTKPKRRR